MDTCILSLTKDNNNTVMWSMYGNRGNGVCIAFELIYVDRKRYHNRMLQGIEQVAFLWTKNERWAYEEEFRLMMQRGYLHENKNPAGEYVPIGPMCVAGLYFGDAASEDIVTTTVARVRGLRRPIKVYKGRRSNRSYGLDFELVSLFSSSPS
jgi:hypothetical protein